MAITIKWGAEGPQAICDTTAEALELLKQGSTSANGSTPKETRGSHGNSGQASLNDKAKAILSETNERTKALLYSIAQFPDGIEAGDLSKASGIDVAAFGGLSGAASKIASKYGVSFEKLVKSEVRFKGSGKDKQRYRWMAPMKLLLDNVEFIKL